MKTILIFVTTLDGKITKWGDPHVFRWTSKEDQQYFKNIWKENRLFIMGSSTFNFDPLKPNPDNLLVVMTSEPAKYAKYESLGAIEFTDALPSEIHDRFANEIHDPKYDLMVVVGGAHIATAFLKAGLIDELWLTLEPKIFGSGSNFVIDEKLDIELRLLTYEKVNEQGTLIMKYEVVK